MQPFNESDIPYNTDFNARYEGAINDLPEDDLLFLTGLSKVRLREWVFAPAKMRPIYMKKWRDEGSKENIFSNIVRKIEKRAVGKTTLTIDQHARISGASIDSILDNFIGGGSRCWVKSTIIEIQTDGKNTLSIPVNNIQSLYVNRTIGLFGRIKDLTCEIKTLNMGDIKGKLLTKQILIDYGQDTPSMLNLEAISAIEGDIG